MFNGLIVFSFPWQFNNNCETNAYNTLRLQLAAQSSAVSMGSFSSAHKLCYLNQEWRRKGPKSAFGTQASQFHHSFPVLPPAENKDFVAGRFPNARPLC